MSALPKWAPRQHAPSLAYIRVHTCKAPGPDAADQVAFLDEPDAFPAHFITPKQNVGGRSVVCRGDDCPHCLEGLPLLTNFYAPALLHTHNNRLNGKEVWERVAFYIPQGALPGFGGIVRGKLFKVWRKVAGCVAQMRSALCTRIDLAEPTFDIKPVLNHFFFPGPATKAELDRVFAGLPSKILPPDLYQHRSERKGADAEALNMLDEVKKRLHYKGESIAQREANGTYAPGKPEGGAE